MTLLDIALLVSAVLLCGAAWTPIRPRKVIAGVSALAIVVLGLLAIVLEGPRWEWLLVGVAVAGAAALLVVRGRRTATAKRSRAGRIVRRTGAVAVTVGCLLLVVAAGGAAWALPRPHFDAPTGPYAVGTATTQWTDPARPEPSTSDPADRRIVVAQAWYPAAGSATDARDWYLGRTAGEATAVTRGLADIFGIPRFLLSEVEQARGTAAVDAPVAAGPASYPVVLFSPGLSGVRTQNTAWAMELASHGYVVVALDHPYDSAAVVLDGGRVVTSRNASTGDDAEDRRRAEVVTAVRAGDLRFALSQLDQDGVPGLPVLAGRLDTQRVAVAGHSLGGAAAIQAAAEDRRFDVAIDLDGFPRNLPTADISRPLLAMVAGQGTGNPANDADYTAQLDRALRLSGSGSFRVTVPGAGHLTFTDAPLYLPPVPSLVGSLGRTAGIGITAGATRAFLDATLNGRAPGDLTAVLGQFGTVDTP